MGQERSGADGNGKDWIGVLITKWKGGEGTGPDRMGTEGSGMDWNGVLIN